MNKKEARLIFKKITNINVKSIEEIYSGFSNQNFIINDAYILRILRPNRDETLLIKNEIENYRLNLEDILNFAEVIKSAPVDELDETIDVNDNFNVFRKDEIKDFEDQDSLL